jgi:hypothetical protein
MKLIKILLVLFLFTNCGKGMGSKVVGGNLSVYYLESSDKDKAEAIAELWKNKDLITTEKQDLQLVQFQDGYELRLIANNPVSSAKIPFNERKILLNLQRAIRDRLKFDEIELVLCNSSFDPIFNINK